jgi:GDPmannose 4,6-dehydratase
MIALITGFTGQDGTHLTRLLLTKGYTVVALMRRLSTEPPYRIRNNEFNKAIDNNQLILETGDLLDPTSLNRIIKTHQPNEIYNLAAQSHVGISFKQPELTTQVDYIGVMNLISTLEHEHKGTWKMYQASTSEMYGNKEQGTLLNEISELNPNSPYAIAKTAAHYYCRSKRSQGLYISTGILFNHESELRGADFVTMKIAKGIKKWIKDREVLELGNMNSVRDWGYAADYVEGMHLILQQDKPDEFVIATGETHTVREFVEAAFKAKNLTIKWQGEAEQEKGYVNGYLAVQVNPEFYRPNEVSYLLGDASKIQAIGWQRKTSFDELVRIMVNS